MPRFPAEKKAPREAEDRKLECGSWLDMHKMLAEGGRAVRSVEGMVSVQKAMFSLVPTTLRFSEGHLMAKPDQDMPSKSAMEAKMFPEEFEDYDPDAIYSSEDEHAWSEPDLDGAEEATYYYVYPLPITSVNNYMFFSLCIHTYLYII